MAGKSAPGRGSDSRMSESPVALLVGFSRGLEEALSIVLVSRDYSVVKVATPTKAVEIFGTRVVDLVVASSRCSISSVVMLTKALGEPRATRVIVLLAGHDPEAERRYREAGLQYVMQMPVHVDDLLRAARSTR